MSRHRANNQRRELRPRHFAYLCAAAVLASAASAAVVERSSPASIIPNAKNASEYWDFIASLDSGHVVLSRFSITNEGPGEHTAYMIGHVVFPDGHSIQFEKGRKKGRWSLSEEGLHIDIGGNQLQLSGRERTLKIDRAQILSDLRFTPASRGIAREPLDDAYWANLLHTSAPVEGTLFVPGMEAPIDVRGSISGTHTWMRRSEPKLNRLRVDFFSLPGGRRATQGARGASALYLSDLTSPKGIHSTWLVLERAGEIVFQTNQFEVELEGKLDANLGKRYPVPSKLVIKGPDIEGEIELSRVVAKDNPMSIIPQPFRFLLSFKTDPRRAWVESSFRVRLRQRSDELMAEAGAS